MSECSLHGVLMLMLSAPKARSYCSSCLGDLLGGFGRCLRGCWLSRNHVKHDSLAALFEYAEAVRDSTGCHVVVAGHHHCA